MFFSFYYTKISLFYCHLYRFFHSFSRNLPFYHSQRNILQYRADFSDYIQTIDISNKQTYIKIDIYTNPMTDKLNNPIINDMITSIIDKLSSHLRDWCTNLVTTEYLNSLVNKMFNIIKSVHPFLEFLFPLAVTMP